MSRCTVCQTELTVDYLCPYCGYDAASLTSDADQSNRHKGNVLAKLQEISIEAGIFKYNESNQALENHGTKSLFDTGLTGVACSQSFVQSKEWVAHFTGKTEVTVNYLFNGKKRAVSAEISPEACEGLWFLYLHINEQLKLDIGLSVVPVKGDGVPVRKLLATVPFDLSD